MAIVKINPDYNWWKILAHTGVDPSETDKYSYENGVLTIPDVSQEALNQALTSYDHEAFLKQIEAVRQRQIAKDPNQRFNDLEMAIAAVIGGAV